MAGPLRLTFDEALTHHVGEFGRAQRRIVALASLFGLPNGLVFLLWVFLSTDPIKRRAWGCADPSDAACGAVLHSPQQDVAAAFCQLPRDTWQWTSRDSVVAEFDLVCSAAWKVQFANSLMFIGCFFGSGLFGMLADKMGRKLPLFGATALSAGATLAMAALPGYWLVAAARLVAGVGASGMVQCIYLVSTEVTGPSFRGRASVLQTIFFCVGEFILVGLAVLVPNWRRLCLAAGCIAAAPLLFFPLIPESARWLLSQGRHEKAHNLLREISVSNGSRLPDRLQLTHSSSSAGRSNARRTAAPSGEGAAAGKGAVGGHGAGRLPPRRNSSGSLSSGSGSSPQCAATALVAIEGGAGGAATDAAADAADAADARPPAPDGRGEPGGSGANTTGFRDLLRHPLLAAMSCVFLLTWFQNFFGYYGIALAAGAIPGSIYATFSLGVVAELAAYVLAALLVDVAGRHNLVAAGLLLGGAASVACAAAGGGAAQMVLAAAAKFGYCVSLAVTPTFTTELYPTPVRSRALGTFNQACRVGSISAPFALLLGAQWGAAAGASAVFLPYVVMGSLGLLAGALQLGMPETLGMAMVETVEDLGQLQTVLSARPWRHRVGCAAACWAIVAFLFRARGAPAAAPRPHDLEAAPPAAAAAAAAPAKPPGLSALGGVKQERGADGEEEEEEGAAGGRVAG